MARQAAQLEVEAIVEYVPLPVEQVEAWRASLLLLADWIIEDLKLHPEENEDERLGVDRPGNGHGGVPALFPVEAIPEGP